jgi:heterogeneous nuclear ribonucleoprotein A1/A3
LCAEKFKKHFQKYGAIADSVIMKDKHTRMPRGFGFVTFSDPSVIDRVLEDEHTIDGRTVSPPVLTAWWRLFCCNTNNQNM